MGFDTYGESDGYVDYVESSGWGFCLLREFLLVGGGLRISNLILNTSGLSSRSYRTSRGPTGGAAFDDVIGLVCYRTWMVSPYAHCYQTLTLPDGRNTALQAHRQRPIM